MPQPPQTQSKKEEIVEIASRLFYEQGFGATGIKQIIESAGIAKGTFYTHFRSKEELGLAWLRGRHTDWSRRFDEATNGSPTGGDQILASFDFLESWLSDAGYRGCAFLNTMAEIPDPENALRQEVVKHKTDLHGWFQMRAGEHFAAGVPGGEEEGRQAGTACYLLFEGALVEAQNFSGLGPIRPARDEAERILHRSPSS